MSVFKRLSASTKALSSTVSSNMVAARSWSLVVRSLHAFKACGWRRLLTVSTIAYERMNRMTEVSSEPTELSEIQVYMLPSKQGSAVCMSSVLSQPPLWHAAAETFIILFWKTLAETLQGKRKTCFCFEGQRIEPCFLLRINSKAFNKTIITALNYLTRGLLASNLNQHFYHITHKKYMFFLYITIKLHAEHNRD